MLLNGGQELINVLNGLLKVNFFALDLLEDGPGGRLQLQGDSIEPLVNESLVVLVVASVESPFVGGGHVSDYGVGGEDIHFRGFKKREGEGAPK